LAKKTKRKSFLSLQTGQSMCRRMKTAAPRYNQHADPTWTPVRGMADAMLSILLLPGITPSWRFQENRFVPKIGCPDWGARCAS
jgi:hypothetical protein